MSDSHTGRRYPVRRRAGASAGRAGRRPERREQQEREVAAALRAMAPGPLGHDEVAARTGLPVEFLRWAWPDLRVLTDRSSH